MENQTAVLRVQPDAGFCLDLFFAAAWLFSKKAMPEGTKRLANSLQYLHQELSNPDADLAAVFCPCGEKYPFFIERYADKVFQYDPVGHVLRDLSKRSSEEFYQDLRRYWLGQEELSDENALPPEIGHSLSALGQKGEELSKTVVAFLQHLQDRLHVVYQTQRKAMTDFQLEMEQKPLVWNEIGVTKKLKNAATLLENPCPNWKIALSLLAEKELFHIASTTEANLLLIGVETKAELYALANRPAEVDRAERIPVLLKALDDPIRLHILELLAERRYYGGELSKLLDMPTPGLSYHLNLLFEAGFVTKKAEGRRMYYSLNPMQFNRLSSDLSERFCLSDNHSNQD